MVAVRPIRPFSETRFRVPARSDRFVHRRRITELLDAHLSRPVILVTGPAGTGKTLAVADWTLEGHLPGPVAWLSLAATTAGMRAVTDWPFSSRQQSSRIARADW